VIGAKCSSQGLSVEWRLPLWANDSTRLFAGTGHGSCDGSLVVRLLKGRNSGSGSAMERKGAGQTKG
jgi:hypothetical protein